MPLQEIERKFLVTAETYKSCAIQQYRIAQGYLSVDPERSVRIRLKANQGILTVKGGSSDDGTTRFEWEKEIPITDANALLELCLKPIIEKTRYEVSVGNHLFEVDEFYGDNVGLVVAEVELSSAEEQFDKPEWLGAEVTGEARYYNAKLSQHPFKNWTE